MTLLILTMKKTIMIDQALFYSYDEIFYFCFMYLSQTWIKKSTSKDNDNLLKK